MIDIIVSIILIILGILVNIILIILCDNKEEIWYNYYIKLERKKKDGNIK